ncbi:MAG: hypothetical protein ACTSRO_09635, partial [Candidatus Heimdallarchaeaceae archaeon]
MNKKTPPKSKPKPDRQFDIIVLKMMGAIAFSVAFLFGGGAIFIYAATRNIPIENYDSYVGMVLGIHLALLMIYYSISL